MRDCWLDCKCCTNLHLSKRSKTAFDLVYTTNVAITYLKIDSLDHYYNYYAY